MSYAEKDTSVHSGQPIECYEFAGSNGTFRYTSYQEAVTVDGDLYEPLGIVRTSVETGSIVNSPVTMDFIIPYDCAVAKRYAFGISPKELNVTVKRVHAGDDFATDFKVEFIGYHIKSTSTGKLVTIQTGSILQARLNGNLSSVYYQRSCNHTLYDVRCKVVKADFTTDAVVTRVQALKITVDDDGVNDGDLDGGKMVNTRTGEERDIVSNTANVVLVGYAFIDIIVGDALQLVQGCDHARLGDCKLKFNNVVNYGGFDLIPEKNPFGDLSNLNSVVTRVRNDRILKYMDVYASGSKV